jgi:hypothetical protein
MTRSELLQAVHDLVMRLNQPLPPEEVAVGWSEGHRVDISRFFQKLESDLRNGVDIPYAPIGKMLDHSGIEKGELLEEACKISVALNERKW